MSDAPQTQSQLARRYLIGVGATAVATALTYLVRPYVAPAVFPFFILAIAVATLYAGRGPGILATVISLGVLATWSLPSLQASTPAGLARLATFMVVAIAIVLVAGSVYERRGWLLQGASEHERLRHLAEQAAAESRDAVIKAEIASQVAAEALARREEAEAELLRSQAELADFFETATTGLHWVDEAGTIVLVNQAELDMLGYQREEYLGHNIAEFHVDQPVIEDVLRRLLSGETLRQYPARVRCKDGQVKHVEIDSSGYFHEGRFSHTRCFTRDVTGELQAQDAVARLAAIVTSSSDAVVGKTLDGTITSWNAAAERIFGYTAEEMVGSSVFRLIPAELHDTEREVLQRLRRGEMVELSEAERLRKDGARIWISLSVSPVRDAGGAITGAASIKRDITERKLLDERMSNVQRLQAVGQLAGGIAHEANNQMSVVLGGTHFLLNRTDIPAEARSDIELIRQAAERTASITRQLLAFSRQQLLRIEDVNLNDVVQSIGPVVQRSLTENQTLEVRLGLLGGMIRADARQLEQVLLNLTLNARDAMPEGGQLTIETAEVELDLKVSPQLGIPTGTYEVLVVRDTGRGMDSATLKRVFEPFFTTKDVGQGTGLGLSVVHGIVNQVGGRIRVESTIGQGTTFRLFFPLASPIRVPMHPVPSEPHRAEVGRVILVVEDDPAVRAITTRALTEVGYSILEAESGKAAVDLVRRHHGRLDFLLTDVRMPGMDGPELARQLEAERPGLAVLLMTGYGDTAHSDYSSDLAHSRVIRKPFSPDELVRAVGEVLTATKSRSATSSNRS